MPSLTRRDFVSSLGRTAGVATAITARAYAAPGGDSANDRVVFLSGDGLGLTPAEYASLLQRLTASREVGEDSYLLGGEIDAFEREWAALLGKEMAVFMPSGTLANHLALRALAGERRRVIVPEMNLGQLALLLRAKYLVDTVNYLTDLSIIGEPWYGNGLAQLMGNTEFREAALGFNETVMDAQAAAAKLHSWQVELQFYGSEKTTLTNWEYAKELMTRAIPNARFMDGESFKVPLSREQISKSTTPYRSNMRRNITQGVPGLGIWWMPSRSDANPNAWDETHIGLFSLIGRSGEAIFQAQKDFASVAKKLDMPSLFPNAIQTPVNWYQYAFIMGNGFGLGRGDNSPEGKKQAAAKLRDVLAENAKLGYGDYRAPPMLQDDVAEQYSYNDHVLRRFNETLKDAIDPNGILSPGRAGVWPAAYRSLRGSLR